MIFRDRIIQITILSIFCFYSFFLYIYPTGNFFLFSKIFCFASFIFGIWLFFSKSKIELHNNQLIPIYFVLQSFALTTHSLVLLFSAWKSLFLVDSDYLGISEVVLNFYKSFTFESPFYGVSTNSNYLTHHFSPILSIFSVFSFFSEYRLGYGYALSFTVFLSSILLFFFLRQKKLQSFDYLFLFFVLTNNVYFYRLCQSFHFELLVIPAFLTLLISFEKNNFIIFILSFFLCLNIKEDISIYLLILSFFVFFKKNKLFGLTSSLFSIVYLFLITSNFLGNSPFFPESAENKNTNWISNWDEWGTSPWEILINATTSPLKLFLIFFSKHSVLIDMLLSISCLILFSKTYFFPFLIICCIHFFSSKIWYNTFYNYYIYSILPLMVFGCVDGYINFTRIVAKIKITRFPNFKPAIIFIFLSLFFYRNSLEKELPYIYKPNPKFEIAIKISELIPKHSKVSTSFQLGGLVKIQSEIFPIRPDREFEEYIFFDETGISPYYENSLIKNRIQNLERESVYTQISSSNSITLYRKIH